LERSEPLSFIIKKGYLLGAGLTLASWILLIANLDRAELVLYPQVMLLGILPMVFGWLFFRNRHPRYHILTSTGSSIEFFVERDGKKVKISWKNSCISEMTI
jgi:hypothetical protein